MCTLLVCFFNPQLGRMMYLFNLAHLNLSVTWKWVLTWRPPQRLMLFIYFCCYGPDDVLTSVWNVCGSWWCGMCHVLVTVFPPLYRSLSKRVPVGRVREHHTRPTHLSSKNYSHLHLQGKKKSQAVKLWLLEHVQSWFCYDWNCSFPVLALSLDTKPWFPYRHKCDRSIIYIRGSYNLKLDTD